MPFFSSVFGRLVALEPHIFCVERARLLCGLSKEVYADPDKLKSFQVSGKILSDDKGKKVKVFKFRRRKDSETLNGHRQSYQTVEITSISKGRSK